MESGAEGGISIFKNDLVIGTFSPPRRIFTIHYLSREFKQALWKFTWWMVCAPQ